MLRYQDVTGPCAHSRAPLGHKTTGWIADTSYCYTNGCIILIMRELTKTAVTMMLYGTYAKGGGVPRGMIWPLRNVIFGATCSFLQKKNKKKTSS